MLITHSETPISPSRATTQRIGAFRTGGRVGSWFGHAGRAVWRHLEDVGQARASRELRLLAARWAISDPELASRIRGASQFDARSNAACSASKQDHATPNGVVAARS